MHAFRVHMLLGLCGLLAGPGTIAQVGATTATRSHVLARTELTETSRAGPKVEVAKAKVKSSVVEPDAPSAALTKFRTASSPDDGDPGRAQEPTSGSQTSEPGTTKATASSESRRIQNIAPVEMWNRVTECFFPRYPPLALETEITGTVNIGLGISPQGDIGNFRVLDGPPLLVQSAIDAIRQWKFRPNEAQGEVTWSRVRALVHFNSDGTTAVDLAAAMLADNFGDPGTPKSAATSFPRPSSSPTCQAAKESAQAPVTPAPIFVDGAYIPGTVGIGFPKCVECPNPTYSDEARAAKVSGTVLLHLIVTEEGRTTSIQVKRSLGHGLDQKAVKAAGNWRFKPAVGPEGKPVPVWIDIEVDFSTY